MNIAMIVASSLDGFIAQDQNQSSLDWTSREDKVFFTRQTKAARFVVMGSTTFATVQVEKMSRGRVIIVLTSKPEQTTSTNLSWTDLSSTTLEGVVAVNLSAGDLIAALEAKGIKQLLVCGGIGVYRQFWQTGHVTKIYLTLESFVFGQGMNLGTALVEPGQPPAHFQIEQLHQLSQQTVVLELIPVQT